MQQQIRLNTMLIVRFVPHGKAKLLVLQTGEINILFQHIASLQLAFIFYHPSTACVIDSGTGNISPAINKRRGYVTGETLWSITTKYRVADPLIICTDIWIYRPTVIRQYAC